MQEKGFKNMSLVVVLHVSSNKTGVNLTSTNWYFGINKIFSRNWKNSEGKKAETFIEDVIRNFLRGQRVKTQFVEQLE